MSKILEKSVHVQLVKYLKEKQLLHELQQGFRDGFSTETCLSWLLDHIRARTSKGLYTGIVLLDVQKAFESVDHKMFL